MKTIILGSDSILTNSVKKKIKDTKVFSARNLNNIDKIHNYVKKLRKFNIIFNNFFPAKNLNKVNSENYYTFINQSIQFNSLFLKNLNPKKINRIIYSSSASVYSLDTGSLAMNKDIYASLKLLNEKLLFSFAIEKKVKVFICRLYNIYSEKNDNFSIISKILKIKKNSKIKINNGGSSIRDFININDVSNIYRKLINYKGSENDILNIGTGKGIRLLDIVNNLNIKRNVKIQNNNYLETDVAISNNENLFRYIKKYKFLSLGTFFSKKFNKRIMFTENPYLKNINYIKKFSNGVFIYGAGIAGKQTYEILKSNNENVLAFIDDDKKKLGKSLYGISVISYDDIVNISKKSKIKKIYLSIPSLDRFKIKKIENKIRKLSYEVIKIPQRDILKNKLKVDIEDINEFDIQTILGREEILTNYKSNTYSYLKNKNVLITGGAGSIGSELAVQLLNVKPRKIHVIDNSEYVLSIIRRNLINKFKGYNFKLLDIKEFNSFNNYVKQNKIDYIFHSAAFKHVDILEENIEPAIQNNIFGTLNVLKSAANNKSNITIISTDKAVKPINVLGFTKRISEILCNLFLNKGIDIKIVRFGNVIGSRGSAIPLFIKQLNNKEPVTLSSYNARRYFMTIKEACYLVIECTKIKNKENLFILNMGKEIKILDLIKNLGNIYKSFYPNFKFKIIKSGLKHGEKIREILFEGKKFKTINSNIFAVREKIYNKNDIENFLLQISNQSRNSNKQKLILMKKFIQK